MSSLPAYRAMADWSTLPADLINRIALCLLDTGDLDYYMDYRAVCRSWRSATAEPKENGRDPSFRLRQWAMLEEPFQSDVRLFVNTATGRFVRKNLPLLRGCCYRLVASAPGGGGDLVLAEASPPHALRVLNPFTGAMTPFAAPLPSENGCVDAHVIGASPTLVLLADSSAKVYFADPDSESFAVYEESYVCSLIRLAVIGGYYAAAGEQGSVASILLSEAIKTRSLAEAIDFNNWLSPEFLSLAVESAGEAMLIFMTDGKVDKIFKTRMEEGSFDDQVRVEEEEGPFEQVKSLGGRALFLSDSRCLSINADKFASIDSDCIYYQLGCDKAYIYRYDLESEETVMIGEAISPLNLVFNAAPPFSPIQLLCRYAYASEARRFELAWEQRMQSLGEFGR